MGKFGLIFCWVNALFWSLLGVLAYLADRPPGVRHVDWIMAAVWTVGALVLDEISKWRRL